MDIKKPIKNITRTVGGIVGVGGRFVDNVYKNLTDAAYKNTGISNPKKTSKRQVN